MHWQTIYKWSDKITSKRWNSTLWTNIFENQNVNLMYTDCPRSRIPVFISQIPLYDVSIMIENDALFFHLPIQTINSIIQIMVKVTWKKVFIYSYSKILINESVVKRICPWGLFLILYDFCDNVYVLFIISKDCNYFWAINRSFFGIVLFFRKISSRNSIFM